MGGSGEVVIVPGYAALINSDEIVDVLVETAEEVLGSQHIHPKKFPSLGVEDFSFFLEKAKGVFYHLGCVNREKGITAPLHSQDFDIDEECLKLGVQLQAQLALKLLKRDIA
jgi:metal-dependent amidase/aminoacylase/carboxypeptidase family protein